MSMQKSQEPSKKKKGRSFPLMFRSTKGRACGWLIYGGRGVLSPDVFWKGKCVRVLRKCPGLKAKAAPE